MNCKSKFCAGTAIIESTAAVKSTDGPVIWTRWRCSLDPSHFWDNFTDGIIFEESE